MNPNAVRRRKVFISYAHSSRATVKKLVADLRKKGLEVSVDMDVEEIPTGPTQGWIRWMEEQLAPPNWVLMFFDETYNIRIDGKVQGSNDGKGRGRTYERKYISSRIYKNYSENDRFIPLIGEGQSDDVVPTIFDGNTYVIPRDTNSLAQKLLSWRDGDQSIPATGIPDLPPDIQKRKAPLWRLAYAFLRLDQLPSGGWGKTLSQWMEVIWEGDAGTIPRSPDIRENGGTDFSCASYYNYLKFIERFDGEQMFTNHNVHFDLFKSLQRRIDHDRSMNAGVQGAAKFNIRHTSMAVITLIHLANYGLFAATEAKITTDYLTVHLESWPKDTSYPFAMFCALTKLAHLLRRQSDGLAFRTRMNRKKRLSLVKKIEQVLPKIRRALVDVSFEEFKPVPEVEGVADMRARPFFVPYCKFWRMKRAGFLMYLHLLIDEQAGTFVNAVKNDDALKNRFFECFKEMLQEVSTPYNPDLPAKSLVRQHNEPGCPEGARDWGLSAQFAALLGTGAVQSLICGHADYTPEKVRELRTSLDLALINTYTQYHEFPELFRFTNALSFSFYLNLIETTAVQPAELADLDHAINGLIEQAVTEESLTAFVTNHIFQRVYNEAKANKPLDHDVEAVRDLLLEKLQSGGYTSEEQLWPNKNWHIRQEITRKFYNGPGGDRYAEKYKSDPVVNFASRLEDMFKPRSLQGLKAIDIGCGPGQYAALLQKQGFNVELYDGSAKMLRYAARELGLHKKQRPRDYFQLANECGDAAYDLVFACAMMVHVPRRFAPGIYKEFYRILKPGGILFVNFKIGDHSLVSLRGRYYQYYRDREAPWSMLRGAGFGIVEIIERWNHQTYRGLPREIRWVNFYCTKPLLQATE